SAQTLSTQASPSRPHFTSHRRTIPLSSLVPSVSVLAEDVANRWSPLVLVPKRRDDELGSESAFPSTRWFAPSMRCRDASQKTPTPGPARSDNVQSKNWLAESANSA